MAVLKKVRVKLTVELTKYNSTWVPGLMGWTVPNKAYSQWGTQDRFAAVQFDNGSYGDILLESLEVVEEKLFYIRSHKHDQHDQPGNELALWWCPNSQGYTYDLAKAGKYTEAEALSICGPFGVPITHGKGPKRGRYDDPSNIAYPVELVAGAATMTVNKFTVENLRLQLIEREKELA